MKRMIFTVLVTACLMLSAVAQKNRGSKPVVDQTQPQMDQRVADAKKRTGKSVDANRMGTPVAILNGGDTSFAAPWDRKSGA
jgi:hypothetical protein